MYGRYTAPSRTWPPFDEAKQRRQIQRLNDFLLKNIEAANARGDDLKASQYADAMVFVLR
jgi:hypothetical protein